MFSIRGPLKTLKRMQEVASQHGWYLEIKECEQILRDVSKKNNEYLTLIPQDTTDDFIWTMIEDNMPDNDELRD